MSIKNNKYIVKINDEEKRLKRIFDDLAIHKECIINSSGKEWHTPIKQYTGIIKKNELIDNFIEPMWIHINRKNNIVENRLIRLKPDVEIEKIRGNKLNYYRFKRRRLI